jgi:hypothetical protein
MINRYASLRQGLVGAWCPSLGASGFRLIDRSGYNNHGTLTNMDPGTDWVASGGKLALDFDGSNDTANFKAITTINGACSLWINPRAYNAVVAGSVGNGAYMLYIESNALYYKAQDSFTSVAYTLPLNTFSHYCVSRTLSTVSFYINGVFLGSGSVTANSTVTVSNFGNYSTGGFPFNGQLDDIRLYTRALTPSEIQLLYTGGRGVGLIPERIKHRRKTTAAATNRRRRILIGASS